MAPKRPFSLIFLLVVALTTFACAGLSTGAAPTEPPLIPTATEPSPLTAGQCSNPLQPVVLGAEWKYALSGMSSGVFTHSITEVRSDGFTDQDVFDSDLTRTGEWQCSNGALTALNPAEGMSAMIQTDELSAQFVTTKSTGVTLPANVKSGDSWTQAFTIEGSQNVSGQEVKGTGDMSYACTAGANESVTVPAGTFDALRVDCQISGTIKVSMAGFELPTDFTSTATIWYAPNVGMVKTENAITNVGNTTIELTSYTIP